MSWPDPVPIQMRRERHFGDRLVTCFADRPRHLDAIFREAVAASPGADAQVLRGERVTYGQLDAQVNCIAGRLAAFGVAKGDRVALSLANRLEFLPLVLACARLGAISVPLNVRMRRPENDHVLRDSGARVLVYEADGAAEIPDGLPDLEHRFVCGGDVHGARPFAALLAPGAPLRAAEVAEEDPCTLLYTSGTTGRPKGAILTHFNVVHSAMHYQACLRYRAGERAILAVPASHVTGLVAVFVAMLRVGGCTVVMPAFNARAFLDLAATEHITSAILVPAMYSLCLMDPEFDRFDLSLWRIGGFGGAPMPEAVIAELGRRLPALTLINAYGATETTSPATVMPPGQTPTHADSVGRVVPCGEIVVMDESGREVPCGQSGEIWIKGPMVVPGYWNNPAATAAAFVGGFWKSGDVGSVDAEGYVRVFDRLKDMINRAGYKVYSVEVENVLMAHPDVVEAAVVGQPDPVLGERVHAVVASRPGASAAALPELLRAFCAERLSDYKVPETFTIVSGPLPRNANGKLLKAELRARLPDRAAPRTAADQSG
jgi:acyl-CoA synthetase (AMP-forming)/AMP-acid ligase II